MSNKFNRYANASNRSKSSAKSHLPVQILMKGIQVKKDSDSNVSTSRSKLSRDYSVEPLRMAITLEDIVKSSQKNALSATLKPELIEPEIEASIPCIEYIPKSLQPALTNFKLLSPIENKTKPHSTFEFSFEQMDKNCKEIEESFIRERQKNTLEEIERAIGKQFNCEVKMVRNENLNCMPKAVIIKSGENIEMFSIRAMDR